MKETPAPLLHVDWEPNVGILEETLFVHVTSTTFLGATLIKAVMNVHMIDIAMMKLGENVKWVPRELDGLNFCISFCLWWGNNFSLSIYSNKTAFAQSSDQQNFKCVNNICEIQSPTRSSELDGEIPSEYIKAGPRSNDYYYVSSLSLPWPQAQYECQSKNGRLAELGMYKINITHMVCKYG